MFMNLTLPLGRRSNRLIYLCGLILSLVYIDFINLYFCNLDLHCRYLLMLTGLMKIIAYIL